jgi:type VI secretion system protein ImpH
VSTHLEKFETDPEGHHVMRAMRLLEAALQPEHPFGTARHASEDKVRFGQLPELAFPKSTVFKYTPGGGGKPAEFYSQFMGFFGPHGPLPLHLTEYARERLRNYRDPTFVAFANMLTHRFYGLFYRAWARAQPAPSMDRGGDKTFENKIAAIAGFSGAALSDRDAVPDLSKRHFAGLFAMGPKNADGLVAMISASFKTQVSLIPFVGTWLELEPEDCWRLGERTGLGKGTGLGRGTGIGSRVWSRGSKFRLRIGPVDFASYEKLLPGGIAARRMADLVRNYAGDQLDWDVNLVLAADMAPAASLDGTTRLGQTSWLGEGDRTRARDDLVFSIPANINPAAAAA